MKFKLVICFLVLIILSNMLCGCSKREFSMDELKKDLISVKFVNFFGVRSEEYKLCTPDEYGERYEIYLTLYGDNAICAAEELSGLKYEHWLGEPEYINGKGIILTYTDRIFYFSRFAMCEINAGERYNRTGGAPLVEDIFNKYCPDIEQSTQFLQ